MSKTYPPLVYILRAVFLFSETNVTNVFLRPKADIRLLTIVCAIGRVYNRLELILVLGVP